MQYLYQEQNKIKELESIRGLAALLVIFFHIPKWNPILEASIINNGYLMVELFFVLSGYVIHSAYANRITTANDLFRFQFLRFCRIYPVHFIFLLVFISIELAKHIAQSKFGLISHNSQPFMKNNITAIVQQLFLVQAIGPTNNASTFNVPAWSISVEFYTYLVFGLFVLFFKKRMSFLFFLLALCSLALLVSQKTYGFSYLLRCFAGFFVGCLTASTTKEIKINIPRYASLLVLTSIALFINIKKTSQYDIAIYFLSAALIASIVISRDGFLNCALNTKALTWMGSISYSIYMSHTAILWIANQVARFILKKPEVLISGKITPQLNEIETITACVLVTISVIMVSYLVFLFIEKPIREKSRRLVFR